MEDEFPLGAALGITKMGMDRDLLSQILAQEGFRAMFVAAPPQNHDILIQEKPELILMDWDLVDSSQNIRFLEKMRKIEECKKIKIILYAEKIIPMIKAVAGDYEVSRVLERSRLEAQLASDIKATILTGAVFTPQHATLARLEMAMENNQQEFEKNLEEAAKKYPEMPKVQIEYGNMCIKKKMFVDAQASANRVLYSDAQNVRAMSLLARALMGMGETKQAIEVLEKANDLSPKNVNRLIQLGQTLHAGGESDKAQDVYREAISEDPEAKEARQGLGQIQLEAGDAQAALETFGESLTEDEVVGMFNNQAVVSINGGNFDPGIKLYLVAKESVKKNKALAARIHYNLALAYKKKNDYTNAEIHLQEAIKLDPSFEKAAKKLSEVNLLKEDTLK